MPSGEIATRQSEVREQLEMLKRISEDMIVNLDKLEERLKLVLRVYPKGDCSKGKDEPALTPLADEIRSIAKVFTIDNGRIAEITQRIEI